jgi:hypothetical protein
MSEARMTGVNEPRVNESGLNEPRANEPGLHPQGANGSGPSQNTVAGSQTVPPTGAPQAGASPTSIPGQTLPIHSRIQLWMHRTSVFLFVLISAVAGVLLIILPWTPEWTDNTLLSYPGLRTIVASGFTRGLCSGLGLLDIWIGFWEALHYHEPR